MNLVRAAVFGVACLLLGGGYLASQSAYLNSLSPGARDATAKYAATVDTDVVRWLALAIFLSCVALAAMRQEAETE